MKKIRGSIKGAVAAACTLSLLAALLVLGLSMKKGGYSIGAEADDFKLMNTDGKMVSMSDHKDAKGFIVIFTCNNCPFSIAYEDRIIALHKKYASQGYPVIAINPNDKTREPADSYENMIKRAKEKKFRFAYLYDEEQQTAIKFGAARTPHVFVLKKRDQSYEVKYIGAIDDNKDEPKMVKNKYVEDAVDALLADKEVPVAFTKAIGCPVKWKN